MSRGGGAGFFDAFFSSGFLGGAVVLGNSSYQNGGAGFLGTADGMVYSTIADNTAYGNGTDATALVRAGIQARRSLVHGNTVTGNGGLGMVFQDAAYRENVINGNAGGTFGGSGAMVDLGANSCNGTATCP